MSADRKHEPPLKLDMDFGEALERFTRTKPGEVAESVERSKTKKPPEEGIPWRQGRVKRSVISSSRDRKPNEN